MRPYKDWPQEENARWLHAGNAFGIHLMQNVRDAALARIPAEASAEARLIAEQAIDTALSALMSMLDGVYPTSIDAEHCVQYTLLACVQTIPRATLEKFELAPDGDGLAMGYWGWQHGNFGVHSRKHNE